jgi:hypothetical protein
VKQAHNIEVEFDLTISFGSARNSLAFWAAGEDCPGSEFAGALKPKAHLMFPSTRALGCWNLAANAGDQTERAGEAC